MLNDIGYFEIILFIIITILELLLLFSSYISHLLLSYSNIKQKYYSKTNYLQQFLQSLIQIQTFQNNQNFTNHNQSLKFIYNNIYFSLVCSFLLFTLFSLAVLNLSQFSSLQFSKILLSLLVFTSIISTSYIYFYQKKIIFTGENQNGIQGIENCDRSYIPTYLTYIFLFSICISIKITPNFRLIILGAVTFLYFCWAIIKKPYRNCIHNFAIIYNNLIVALFEGFLIARQINSQFRKSYEANIVIFFFISLLICFLIAILRIILQIKNRNDLTQKSTPLQDNILNIVKHKRQIKHSDLANRLIFGEKEVIKQLKFRNHYFENIIKKQKDVLNRDEMKAQQAFDYFVIISPNLFFIIIAIAGLIAQYKDNIKNLVLTMGVRQKFEGFLKIFDFFSITQFIRYQGDGEFKTATGGFFSIILITIFSVLFFQAGFKIVNYLNVTSTQDSVYQIMPSQSILKTGPQGKFMFAISVYGLDLSNPNITYFDIRLKQHYYKPIGIPINATEIPLEVCTSSHFNFSGDILSAYSKYNASSWLCPKMEMDLAVMGSISSDMFASLAISVSKSDSVTRKSQKFIELALRQNIIAKFSANLYKDEKDKYINQRILINYNQSLLSFFDSDPSNEKIDEYQFKKFTGEKYFRELQQLQMQKLKRVNWQNDLFKQSLDGSL